MKLIPILILSLFLFGCGIFKKEPIAVISNATIKLDREALEYCSFLKEGVVINTFEDAMVVYTDIATLYTICAGKQATSIKLLKQFGGVK